MKTLSNQITARFVTDNDLRPQITVVSRTKSTAKVIIDGIEVKRKIYSDSNKEYIFPYGRYSMAPIAY